MTRDDAIAVWLDHGQVRAEAYLRSQRPQRWCDEALLDNAEDTIDGLVALGLLKLEADPSDSAVKDAE